MGWIQRVVRRLQGTSSSPSEEPQGIERLERRCLELEQALKAADHDLREKGDLLYGLQQRYSSEHFDLQETMRNLKIERLRNAGIRSAQDIVLQRYAMLRERVAHLKTRLRCYEQVTDEDIDDESGVN